MNESKIKRILLRLVILSSLLMVAATSSAATADISYNGTDLGGGWWQLDYMITNTSVATNDYIYGFLVTFDSSIDFGSLLLPAGWNGIAGAPKTTFAMAYSPALSYDTAPSQTANVSFKVKDYTADVDYTVFLDNHQGTRSTLSGTTVVPEPLSIILFVVGGTTLGLRSWMRRRKGQLNNLNQVS